MVVDSCAPWRRGTRYASDTWTGRRISIRPRRALLSAGLALIGLVALAGDVHGGGEGSMTHVRVHSGDTLWAIAGRLYGSDDLRDRVDDISRLNDLEGGVLQPGQVLLVEAP